MTHQSCRHDTSKEIRTPSLELPAAGVGRYRELANSLESLGRLEFLYPSLFSNATRFLGHAMHSIRPMALKNSLALFRATARAAPERSYDSIVYRPEYRTYEFRSADTQPDADSAIALLQFRLACCWLKDDLLRKNPAFIPYEDACRAGADDASCDALRELIRQGTLGEGIDKRMLLSEIDKRLRINSVKSLPA